MKILKQKTEQNILISFSYDPRLVEEIKKTVPGRRWNPSVKAWEIPLTSEEAADKFIAANSEIKELAEDVFSALQTKTGTPCSEPSYPASWNHYKREYVAIISLSGKKLQRDFLGSRVDFTSSGANAGLKYEDSDLPENLPVGAIIEIKSGSHKHCDQDYYRKDEDGWKSLGSRSGTSGFFGGYKESIAVLL